MFLQSKTSEFSLMAFAAVAALAVGCDRSAPLPAPDDSGGDGSSVYADLVEMAKQAKFEDSVESNHEDDGSVSRLSFIDTEGNRVSIGDFNGTKNIVLVFTRGFSGELCPFCTTQTSRLIANYDKFKQRNAEVLLVYPGSKKQLPRFKEAGLADSGEDGFPFPVLLDEDLAAVNELGIAAQQASPSTFIIDRDGKVRLSYVGSSPTDRPSIKAMLEQLDRLQEAG